MTIVSSQAVFSNSELYPLLYHLILLKKYGSEYYNWDPETVRLQIKDDFNISISDIISNKIQAVSTLLVTDQFYIYWEAFESITKALITGYPQFVHVTPLYPEEICWGLISACLNDSDYNSIKELPLSPEVIGYITVTLEMQGIYNPPKCIKDMPFDKNTIPKDTQDLKSKILFMVNTLLFQIKKYFPELKDEIKSKLQKLVVL